MFRWQWLLVFLFCVGKLLAQDLKQPVSGRVLDAFRSPLVGAHVTLSGPTSRWNAVSDEEGHFRFNEVPVGRYWLSIFFAGHEPFQEELIVNSSRPVYVKAELRERTMVLNNITIQADSTVADPSGVRTITIEKTMRVPANFFDPVRMVTSYPGVVATNDQSNSIVVKGFSPNALLWRLQGLDIVNPNHLANAGTFSDKPAANGGGVNVLSAQLLDKTNFYSGNLPVQLSNALSGAIDMSLRAGDKEKAHYTAQASLIGMDVAAEAPIIRGKSSILANYRYSTVGLLSNLGINFGDEQISFQDFSFHYDHDQKNNGRLSVFGFGGLSLNRFDRKPSDEWKEEKDRYDIDYESRVFGIGFTEQIPITPKTILKAGGAFSGQFQERISESAPVTGAFLMNSNYENNKTILSSFLSATHKLKSSVHTEWGMYITRIDQQVLNKESRIDFSSSGLTANYTLSVNTFLLQPYARLNMKISPRISVEGGIRLFYLTNFFSEPRISLKYQSSIGMFYINHGITHHYQPQVALPDKADHVISSSQSSLNYQLNLAGDWNINSSLYYFLQKNVPVNATRNFSVLNALEELSVMPLTANGKGRNYGWEVWLEKKFRNLSYVSGGLSLYRSEYRIDQTYLPSRFDGRFTANAIAGKEWSRKKNVVGLNLRVLYLGGFREQPIDPFQSLLSGTTSFNFSAGFTQKLLDYFRTDLRVSWRKNKPKYTRTVSIDIQNLTAQQNVAYRYYDTFLQAVQTKNQLSLIPILVYRVDF